MMGGRGEDKTKGKQCYTVILDKHIHYDIMLHSSNNIRYV